MLDLDYWPGNLLNNFVLKTYLPGATTIVKNNDKSIFIVYMHLAVMA